MKRDRKILVLTTLLCLLPMLLGALVYDRLPESMVTHWNLNGEPASLKACEALFDELDKLLQAAEPASGTEYHRNFPVQGGCVLEISAFSGPVLVVVTDAMADPGSVPNAVRFYVLLTA